MIGQPPIHKESLAMLSGFCVGNFSYPGSMLNNWKNANSSLDFYLMTKYYMHSLSKSIIWLASIGT